MNISRCLEASNQEKSFPAQLYHWNWSGSQGKTQRMGCFLHPFTPNPQPPHRGPARTFGRARLEDLASNVANSPRIQDLVSLCLNQLLREVQTSRFKWMKMIDQPCPGKDLLRNDHEKNGCFRFHAFFVGEKDLAIQLPLISSFS